MLALLATPLPAASVRVPGGGESASSGRARRSYLRSVSRQALIEDEPAPAVLVNNGSSSGSKRAAAAGEAQPQISQASALELLRRAFLGLGPDPSTPAPSGPAAEEQQLRAAGITEPAPQIQNPKASPLPVPPIEGLESPPLVAEEVLATLPLPRPAGQSDPRDLQEAPLCAPALEWKSIDGELWVNGQPFHLKGTNWFGFEEKQRSPFGLDEHDMDFYFQFLVQNKFNALRVPLSVDFALNPDGDPDEEADAKVRR